MRPGVLYLLLIAGCTQVTAFANSYDVAYPVHLSCPEIGSDFASWYGIGGRPRDARHQGIDIAASVGYPVIAAADGMVILAEYHPLAGRRVYLRHGPTRDGYLFTGYVHLDSYTVEVGTVLRRGNVLGTVGKTGPYAGGVAHLHFELWGGDAKENHMGNREADAALPLPGSELENPHRWWHRDGPQLPHRVTIPAYEAGKEYPAEEVRLTYPLPCR